MKHISHYDHMTLNEGTEFEPLGFVLSLTLGSRDIGMSYTIAGIYDTFYDFAVAVNEDLGTGEFDDFEGFKDINELVEHLYDAMEIREGIYNFWHGFKVRANAKPGYHTADNDNAYKVVGMLDGLFTNAQEIMMSKTKKNTENDESYIARSVERDPDKLELYDEKEYEKIVKMLNWDQKKLDAVLKVNRIKDQL